MQAVEIFLLTRPLRPSINAKLHRERPGRYGAGSTVDFQGPAIQQKKYKQAHAARLYLSLQARTERTETQGGTS
jgi:hypothetical protein